MYSKKETTGNQETQFADTYSIEELTNELS